MWRAIAMCKYSECVCLYLHIAKEAVFLLNLCLYMYVMIDPLNWLSELIQNVILTWSKSESE